MMSLLRFLAMNMSVALLSMQSESSVLGLEQHEGE